MADPDRVITDAFAELMDADTGLVVGCTPNDVGRIALAALAEAGLAIIPDDPDHYVTFDTEGWFVEHSIACRAAGTLGTCAYNTAVRDIADDFGPDTDPDRLGRWQITNIDSEGLPSMERAK